MLPPSDEDIDAELAALDRAFVARVPSRLEMLAAEMTAINGADGDHAKVAVGQLEQAAHGISGSAGQFGYAKLSTSAAALEQACLEILKTGAVDQVAVGRLQKLYEKVAISAKAL